MLWVAVHTSVLPEKKWRRDFARERLPQFLDSEGGFLDHLGLSDAHYEQHAQVGPEGEVYGAELLFQRDTPTQVEDILQVGKWETLFYLWLSTALRIIAHQSAKSRPDKKELSINIDLGTLMKKGFVYDLKNFLSKGKYSLDDIGNVGLEVTEKHGEGKNIPWIVYENLKELARMGFRLSVDDYDLLWSGGDYDISRELLEGMIEHRVPLWWVKFGHEITEKIIKNDHSAQDTISRLRNFSRRFTDELVGQWPHLILEGVHSLEEIRYIETLDLGIDRYQLAPEALRDRVVK
jgi:hypothetical protein